MGERKATFIKPATCHIASALVLVVLLCAYSSQCPADEFSPPAQVPNSQKQSAWLFGMNRTYDQWFVERKEVRTKDPYIWVYNESFAKDFGMPERWMDKELKGADALALRTGTAFPLCGWNGQADACNVSHACILEIYFNRKDHPLPWSKQSRWTDLQMNQTSMWTLGTLRPVNRAESVEGTTRSPFEDPGNGNELFWWYEWADKRKSGGGASVRAYDRSAFEDYSLVVLDINCTREEYAGLHLRSTQRSGRAKNIFSSINFPKSWIDRVRPVLRDVEDRQSNLLRHRFEELKSLEK